MSLIIGPHMSTGKGFHKAVEEALSIGATTMQVFSRNPRGGNARQVSDEEFACVRKLSETHQFGPIVVHAPYTVNLASSKSDVRAFGQQILQEDFQRVRALNACGLVVHSGSHTGAGQKIGEKRLLEAIDNILPYIPKGKRLLLETMSGSGTELGASLSEMANILRQLDAEELVGVCLDTCHLFASGLDLRQWSDAKSEIGNYLDWRWIGACHINDSKIPLAGHRDRHEVLGRGFIGWEPFYAIAQDKDMQNLPLILETPNELSGWQSEIASLRRCASL